MLLFPGKIPNFATGQNVASYSSSLSLIFKASAIEFELNVPFTAQVYSSVLLLNTEVVANKVAKFLRKSCETITCLCCSGMLKNFACTGN